MSILAGGWVETKTYDEWGSVIKVDDVINQSYDAFGCLFGVMNYTGLNPTVPLRALPTDLSSEATRYGLELAETGGTLHQTWVTWADLKQMDMDEVGIDERAHYYRRAADGSLINHNRKGLAPDTPEHLYPGLTWERQDTVYMIHTITRREIFDKSHSGWLMLFDMMKILERNSIDTDIRLVMWFW